MKIFSLIGVLCLILAAAFCAAAQSDVERKTVAVTYELGQPVDLQFRGTTRFPRLRGQARVERKNRTGTKVLITIENLPRPYELGGAYTTYILWAITPEGRADNLGELKYRSGVIFQNPKGEFTTPLQTFALIVTAEPHYLVKQPSQAVILENLPPANRVSNIVNVSYFGNSSDYLRDPRPPEIADADYVKTPVSLLGARQAINLAKFAGAERDAAAEYEYAQRSLEQAERAWREGNMSEQQVDVLARQAIAAGVKAEEVAGVRKIAREQRNEKARADAEIRRAENRTLAAEQERDEIRAELAREQRNRELAERDSSNFSNQLAEMRKENQNLRDEIARLRQELEDAKVRAARADADRENLQKQREFEQRAARLRAAAPILIASLKQFGPVAQTERGITVTLSENLWKSPREAVLAVAAEPKIERLAQTLANNLDYRFLIESHTDDGGAANVLMDLTNERARILGEKLAAFGVAADRLETKGLGATAPIAPNTTNLNRAKNRRTELTLIVSDNPQSTQN
jgi:outer membrane protein OmpA-like peptidoglycan-associated protein